MRVNRPRAAMRSSRRSGAAWSRRSTRSRRRAISRVRAVGLMPRAISYWCRRARAGERAFRPVVRALVLPGCAPGLRFGGRAVGLLLVFHGLEGGGDDAEGGGLGPGGGGGA